MEYQIFINKPNSRPIIYNTNNLRKVIRYIGKLGNKHRKHEYKIYIKIAIIDYSGPKYYTSYLPYIDVILEKHSKCITIKYVDDIKLKPLFNKLLPKNTSNYFLLERYLQNGDYPIDSLYIKNYFTEKEQTLEYDIKNGK